MPCSAAWHPLDSASLFIHPTSEEMWPTQPHPQGVHSLTGETHHRQINKYKHEESSVTKVREENNAGGRGRKHRGRPGGGPRTACPPGSLGQGSLPKSAGTVPGIRNSMGKSPEVRTCWMCLRRKPVWPDPSGQGDRVAGVIRDMGGGRSGCTSSWESLAQNWGQRLFENPGRRGPHFKHARIRSSIIHSGSVIQIHSFFIYSFIFRYLSFVHCLLLGIL